MPKNNNRSKVMVCVTRQRSCERLIKHGAQMAKQLGYGLLVVHAVTPNAQVMGNPDLSNALEALFQTTKEYNGEMTVLRHDDVLDALAECAISSNVALTILGASPKNAAPVLDRLKAKLPEMHFIVLEAQSELENLIKSETAVGNALHTA